MVGVETQGLSPCDLGSLTTSTASWPRLVEVYAYSLAAKMRYRVFVRDKRLYGGNDTASATELIPLTAPVFFQKGSIHTMIFIQDATGRVTEVVMLHKYSEVEMHRIQNR